MTMSSAGPVAGNRPDCGAWDGAALGDGFTDGDGLVDGAADGETEGLAGLLSDAGDGVVATGDDGAGCDAWLRFCTK